MIYVCCVDSDQCVGIAHSLLGLPYFAHPTATPAIRENGSVAVPSSLSPLLVSYSRLTALHHSRSSFCTWTNHGLYGIVLYFYYLCIFGLSGQILNV